jgi:hypothetical protein
MSYTNLNNPANYQLQSFGQDGMRTISTTQAYVEGEYYRVLVATEDSTLSATSMVGDDLASIDVYAGTTIYGLFTAVTVTAGEVTAYLAGRTDIDDVWAYIRAYGVAGGATIEGEDCAKAAISPLLDKYYAKASLVMVPSLYKTSIVYSERPLSTDGELTFIRASSASRIGPDGLIEKVRTNLVPDGLLFNASTGVLYTTVTSDSPISGVSSTRITKNEAAGTLQYGIQTCSTPTIASNTTHTISRFFKYDGFNTTTSIESNIGGQWSGTFIQNIDIASTGVTLQAPVGCTSKITNVGSGWYRVDVTIAIGTVTVGGPVTYLLKVASALSTGQGFLTAAPQLETGDIATDYIPTTTVAVSVGPVANLPRLNYPINSDGSVGCPSLLLEPQRTNLNPYSEQFDNADWEKTNTTITANATTSPDGYTNADAWLETTTNDWHRLYDNGFAVTSGTAYTCSLFVKANGRNWVSIEFYAASGGFNGSRVWFNIANGTIGTTQTGITAKIENYGNGWYRISATQTAAASTTGYILYLLATGDGVVTYAGDVTKGAFVYGGMTEAGAYATSYIPTLGAAVTRLAESTSRSGLGLTNSTFVLNFQILSYVAELFDFTKTGGGRMFYIAVQSNGFVTFNSVSGGSIGAIGTAIAINTSHKIAFTLNASTSNVSVFINGVKIGTYATDITTFGAFSGLQTFGYVPASKVEQILIFPSVLTDADCIALTA